MFFLLRHSYRFGRWNLFNTATVISLLSPTYVFDYLNPNPEIFLISPFVIQFQTSQHNKVTC